MKPKCQLMQSFRITLFWWDVHYLGFYISPEKLVQPTIRWHDPSLSCLQTRLEIHKWTYFSVAMFMGLSFSSKMPRISFYALMDFMQPDSQCAYIALYITQRDKWKESGLHCWFSIIVRQLLNLVRQRKCLYLFNVYHRPNLASYVFTKECYQPGVITKRS